MSHLVIGDYRFSGRDCWRTLQHAEDFLDAFPSRTHEVLQPRKARVAAAIAGVDVESADRDVLQPVLARVWAELLGARDDVVAAGLQASHQTGRVQCLHAGDGGVPKPGVSDVRVGFSGIVGDRQATRKHHGSPFQALCIWNVETIEELRAEGHPIAPGCAGENVTVSGVDWPSIQPGTRLQIGSVVCDVSSYAVPCAKNAQWFADRDFGRIHHDRATRSRLYATVRTPGKIALGDVVVVEPPGGSN